MHYDLVIIGAGFAGQAAIKRAAQLGLSFCVVAEGTGATQHFSGAFDLIDPRWSNPQLKPAQYPPLTESLQAFLLARPHHLYGLLAKARPFFIDCLAEDLADFFSFYELPVVGGGNGPVVAFGPIGEPKPTAYALAGQGVLARDCAWGDPAVFLAFPGLVAYPAALIEEGLARHFRSVRVVLAHGFEADPRAPLVSLLKRFESKEALAALIAFLQTAGVRGQRLFMPPVLGVKNWQGNHKALSQAIGVDPIELLSVLPSTAGLRLDAHLKAFWSRHPEIAIIKGRVTGIEASGDRVTGVVVSGVSGQQQVLEAQQFVLATGKYLGGGIVGEGSFSEPVFGLSLEANDISVSEQTLVSSQVHKDPLSSQPFLSVGVRPQSASKGLAGAPPKYSNVRACGHVLSGFDFTRERCGFGVSLASANACFEPKTGIGYSKE